MFPSLAARKTLRKHIFLPERKEMLVKNILASRTQMLHASETNVSQLSHIREMLFPQKCFLV